MTFVPRLFLAALVSCVVATPVLPASAADPITVFLVRHAEKAGGVADPSLTDAGRERAESLAEILADAGIGTIFTSQYKRTRETAAPLAGRLGLTVTVTPASDLKALVSKVRALPAGARALIVGHSDTVPALAHRLTGAKVAELTDADYDRLYVVTCDTGGQGEVVVLRYAACATAQPAP